MFAFFIFNFFFFNFSHFVYYIRRVSVRVQKYLSARFSSGDSRCDIPNLTIAFIENSVGSERNIRARG